MDLWLIPSVGELLRMRDIYGRLLSDTEKETLTEQIINDLIYQEALCEIYQKMWMWYIHPNKDMWDDWLKPSLFDTELDTEQSKRESGEKFFKEQAEWYKMLQAKAEGARDQLSQYLDWYDLKEQYNTKKDDYRFEVIREKYESEIRD